MSVYTEYFNINKINKRWSMNKIAELCKIWQLQAYICIDHLLIDNVYNLLYHFWELKEIHRNQILKYKNYMNKKEISK